MIKYLLVLPLRREGCNKLMGLGYFWQMNEQSAVMFKKFMCQQIVKSKDFQKDRMFFYLKIYVLGVWSKACKCLALKRLDQVA